jgi:hypothetical protein
MLDDPFENAIAFFLICGIVFFEDISLFSNNKIMKPFALFVLVISTFMLSKDHTGIAMLCAVLLLLLLVRNSSSKFVVR